MVKYNKSGVRAIFVYVASCSVAKMEQDRVRNFIRVLKVNFYACVGGIISLGMGPPKLVLEYLLHSLAFITGSSRDTLCHGLRRRGAALWAFLLEFGYMFQIERGDTYIDELLKEAFQCPVIYDPYKIDDRSFRINKRMLSAKVSVHVQLYNGYIAGLQTVKRRYESLLTRQDEKLNAKVDLRAGPFSLIYTGKAKFGDLIRIISVVGSLKYVNIDMEFTSILNTGKGGKLHKFSINGMQEMTFTVSGLGPLKWAEESIIRHLTTTFESFLRFVINFELARRIDDILKGNKIPVVGNDSETDTDSSFTDSESDEPNPHNPYQKAPVPQHLV